MISNLPAPPSRQGERPRATLIYNPNAAGTNTLPSDAALKLLERAGIKAHYRPTSSKSDLPAALHDPGDLVVVAGGDGTFRAVALYLKELGLRVPLTLVPLGTANNIARTLDLTGDPRALLTGLACPKLRSFDLGVVRGPWGEAKFLEAFGFGLFAQSLAAYNPDAGKSVVRAVQVIIGVLRNYEPTAWQITLDGEDLSGSYLVVEVMNTASTGTRLCLAPGADPSDGLLDIVLVKEDARVGLASYLASLTFGKVEALPNVTVKRGKRLEFVWDGSPLHVDAQALTGDETPDSDSDKALCSTTVEVTLELGALELWLPTRTGEAA